MDDVKEIMAQAIKEAEKEKEKEAAAAAVAEAAGEEAGEVEEEEEIPEDLEQVEEKTLNALQQINAMNTAERIKLALTGSKTQRMILIKDANKMVSSAVLESPKIGLDEISLLAKNKSLAGDLIAKISRKRDWTKNYSIIIELVQNPKTPVKDALGFVKKLHIRDLQLFSRDKNINPVVRTLAMNYFKQKSGIK